MTEISEETEQQVINWQGLVVDLDKALALLDEVEKYLIEENWVAKFLQVQLEVERKISENLERKIEAEAKKQMKESLNSKDLEDIIVKKISDSIPEVEPVKVEESTEYKDLHDKVTSLERSITSMKSKSSLDKVQDIMVEKDQMMTEDFSPSPSPSPHHGIQEDFIDWLAAYDAT